MTSLERAIDALIALILPLLFVLSACGGDGGGGSSQQGDKPVGDGNNVQRTAAAQITIHRDDGDVVLDFKTGGSK